jgi:hypothetical protein
VVNVTPENRDDVDRAVPRVLCALLTENQSHVLHYVTIPNTRERPDVILYEGEIYEVVSTRKSPAEYRKCYVLQAEAAPHSVATHPKRIPNNG